MEFKDFKIVYQPFPMSTATSEIILPAKDEDDALQQFRKNFGAYGVVSIAEEGR